MECVGGREYEVIALAGGHHRRHVDDGSLCGSPCFDSVERTTYFVAICMMCTPVLPMPFTEIPEMTGWVAEHFTATQHRIMIERQVR